MKKILITGKNSYIGTSLENWLAKEPENYQVDTVDTRDGIWKEKDFSPYDVVFHVAGIAHVSTDPNMKELYYKVNRDLTIDIAKKAKAEGVKQFIFMSSIIVYGDSTHNKPLITRDTIPAPSNFYGDSKLQAERCLEQLSDDSFRVALIRPPMIYGKGSKGNYNRLSKLAKKTPFFPDFNNHRSMLHIDNLCEFLKLLVDYSDSGLFFPQNKEFVNTTSLVLEIGKVHGRKIHTNKFFNLLIKLLMRMPTISKVFGDLIYSSEISQLPYGSYIVSEFSETISKTESKVNLK